MNKTVYVPERGDIVWLSFDPQAGHEQAGRRPALVLSPNSYNRLTGLMLCCPITNQVKDYPFEVAISGKGAKTSSVALADQVKSLDWQIRKAEKNGTASPEIIEEVLGKLGTLLS